jgi:hypothetical protein
LPTIDAGSTPARLSDAPLVGVLQRWQAEERRRFRENGQIELDPAKVKPDLRTGQKAGDAGQMNRCSAASCFQENYAEPSIAEAYSSLAVTSRGIIPPGVWTSERLG